MSTSRKLAGWAAVGAAAVILAACSSSPSTVGPIKVVAPATGGDVQHQLNVQSAATGYLLGHGSPSVGLAPRSLTSPIASDIAQLQIDLYTSYVHTQAAIGEIASNPNAATLNSIAALYAQAAGGNDLAKLQADLNATPPPPSTTTTTTTSPPSTTTSTTKPPTTTTTSAPGAMSPPAGYSTSQVIEDDQFKGTTLSGYWNTFYGPGTPWNNRGALPSPYTGGNQPGSNDLAFYGPNQVVVSNGLTLNAVPSTQFQSQGYTMASGVVTSKNTLPSGGFYVQVKAQMPDTSHGMWPAIWLLPGSSAQELDGYEGGWPGSSPNMQGHSDTFASTGEQQSVWATGQGADVTVGYHVYGMQFIPGTGMKLFFDGRQVYASSANLSQQSYYLFIQLQVAAGQTSGWHTVCSGSCQPGSMKVAEVQVYTGT